MSEIKSTGGGLLGRLIFWIVIAFIIFSIVLGLILEFVKSDKPDVSRVVGPPVAKAPDGISRSSATGACMLFIKKNLHDPDSAQFEHSNEAAVFLNKNRAFVIRSVRAKNGFGAMRKDEFACFLEMRGNVVFPVLIVQKGQREKEVAALMKEWGVVNK